LLGFLNFLTIRKNPKWKNYENMLVLGRSTSFRIFFILHYFLDHAEINFWRDFFYFTGWAKKMVFLIFWDPEIYFSKNESSRGNFMENRLRAFPERENASLTLIQGKSIPPHKITPRELRKINFRAPKIKKPPSFGPHCTLEKAIGFISEPYFCLFLPLP
jgi:hypothetical protein